MSGSDSSRQEEPGFMSNSGSVCITRSISATRSDKDASEEVDLIKKVDLNLGSSNLA